MYTVRRGLQLARACRAGYNVATRRAVSLGAARIASFGSPAGIQLRNAPGLNSLRAPMLFFRRGYAGMCGIGIIRLWGTGLGGA